MSELSEKWRKIITDCPEQHRHKWQHTFEAIQTCADELDERDAEIRAIAEDIVKHCVGFAWSLGHAILKKLGGAA